MSSLFLTGGELRELTGFAMSHKQTEWLRSNRWKFVLNRHNEPRVAREHFNERMGCGSVPHDSAAGAINHAAAFAQPNFAAIDRR